MAQWKYSNLVVFGQDEWDPALFIAIFWSEIAMCLSFLARTSSREKTLRRALFPQKAQLKSLCSVYYLVGLIIMLIFFIIVISVVGNGECRSIFSSPVRRTESYSDTPGVSVSVSVKMLKFLVQVIQKLAINLICVLEC